ncbi:MAG: hypothetical protein PHS28_05380 [Atopobiaceae bacterium]|nr:hypothetical protein [Atopobiaceae bacterium]
MVSGGAYPDDTWEGDPSAPWNDGDVVNHVCGTCAMFLDMVCPDDRDEVVLTACSLGCLDARGLPVDGSRPVVVPCDGTCGSWEGR